MIYWNFIQVEIFLVILKLDILYQLNYTQVVCKEVRQ
jgi:hypothetical protein